MTDHPPRFTPLEYDNHRREMTPWAIGGIIGTATGVAMMRKGRRRNNWLFGGGIMLTSQSLILLGFVGNAMMWAKRSLRRYRRSLKG